MTYSVQELESLLDDFRQNEIYTGWTGLDWFFQDFPDAVVGLDEIGTVQIVEHNSRRMIVSVTDPDGNVRYFQKNGYYSSYDGTDWDGGFFEVRPAEQVIVTKHVTTVYKKIDGGSSL
ncbi:hypothetical protein SAMN05421776_11717 [Nocardia farcinica]|uniref:Uncharacterized protein n=1 Tax=Nocardia farcinica TaxID=37329 RepID=A0A0H5NX06_NOCFR|nr:hypothetical protein [Nocardia farcinica]AXK86569.1 hypothetical protein DXT66_13865 [Nocardia farcinica]PFW99024.1 hypothetical protein CJ469_05624 [Nocardia farcinica]PFX06062.1 hypothetical protein CJ468_04922 [Nocardia farcinica]CRY79848.1 Uncharacterised protein [Nocardia farcinica]SIT33578.1 hypothetical protein SAMN05421776_11717 [Nocardia farcinica]